MTKINGLNYVSALETKWMNIVKCTRQNSQSTPTKETQHILKVVCCSWKCKVPSRLFRGINKFILDPILAKQTNLRQMTCMISIILM